MNQVASNGTRTKRPTNLNSFEQIVAAACWGGGIE
jgi:hypothetical protein